MALKQALLGSRAILQIITSGAIVPHRVVEHIGVAVQRLRIARLGGAGVGLDEAVQGGVVVAGFAKVQAEVVKVKVLPGVAVAGGCIVSG